jgi:hypothetical protein
LLFINPFFPLISQNVNLRRLVNNEKEEEGRSRALRFPHPKAGLAFPLLSTLKSKKSLEIKIPHEPSVAVASKEHEKWMIRIENKKNSSSYTKHASLF